MVLVTLSITGTVDGTEKTVSRSMNLDDAALPYFFDFYRSCFGQTGEDDSPPTKRDMTDEETFAKFADTLSATAIQNVQNWLRDKAAQQARDGTPVITGKLV